MPGNDTLTSPDGAERAATDGPCLVVAFCSDAPTAAPLRFDLTTIDSIALVRGGDEATWTVTGAHLQLACADAHLSRCHAELSRAIDRFAVRDAGSKNGTRVNGAPVGPGTSAILVDGDVIEVGHTFLVYLHRVPRAAGTAALRIAGAGLQSMDPTLAARFTELIQVARSELSILVLGESGTGKELAARAVHDASGRRGSFVAVNCGGIPATLFESEMFGHRRGTFSGATEDRAGLIRAADKGTLFLDEIGDLQPAAQAALLRAVQEREVRPVGERQAVPVDFRLIAATHVDLRAAAARGAFRLDLLARITGFVVELPPLRRRRQDLGLIVRALLARHAGRAAAGVSLERTAARWLFEHGWPGNVRELEQALAGALVVAGGKPIRREHLPATLLPTAQPPPAPAAGEATPSETPPAGASRRLTRADLARRDRIVQLLATHEGNVAAVARAMGKGRTQVRRWIARYGIVV